MMMRFSAALCWILLTFLGCNAEPGAYWILISAGCEIRFMQSTATTINLMSNLPSNGDCENMLFAIADSNIIAGEVVSKTNLRLTSVPMVLDTDSLELESGVFPNEDGEADWFKFANDFTEVNHSTILGPHCSYAKESFALFVDMNILYAVAECKFPNSGKVLGALTRSLIQSDGIVNTPPQQPIYFDRGGLNRAAVIPGNATVDAQLWRYQIAPPGLRCASAELHTINQTTTIEGGTDVHAAHFYAYYTDAEKTAVMVVERLTRYNNVVFYLLPESEYLCGINGAPLAEVHKQGLVFVARFNNLKIGEAFKERPKILDFVVGPKEGDWWTAEYRKEFGGPSSCPKPVYQLEIELSTERDTQITVLYLIYTIVGFEMLMFACVVGLAVVALICNM